MGAIGGVVLFLATLAPAGAQQGAQVIRDPKGRFTISVPQSWSVTAMDISTVSLSGNAKSMVDGSSTMLFAMPPIKGKDLPVPMFWLMTMKAPKEFSPDLFADFGKVQPPAENPFAGIFGTYDFNVVQSGTAKIAGHPGSYAYVTVTPHQLGAPPSGSVFPPQGMYAVYALFGVGRMAVFAMAMTVNDPDRVRADVATVSHILETLKVTPRASIAPLP